MIGDMLRLDIEEWFRAAFESIRCPQCSQKHTDTTVGNPIGQPSWWDIIAKCRLCRHQWVCAQVFEEYSLPERTKKE
jgi:hypothetical protein